MQLIDDTNPNRLLIIDDDLRICEFMADVADEAGYEALHTASATEFITFFESFKPSLLFIDLIMPNTDGIELLRLLANHPFKTKICVMSGTDKKVLHTARALGLQLGLDVFGTISKPVNLCDLENLLNQARKENTLLCKEELSTAINEKQLLLHYQPKMSLDVIEKAVITGVEALVRWQHPRLGLIYPDSFIALAERSGLIAGLTDSVIDLAIEQLNIWHKEGLELTVAVNISPYNLTDLQMPDRIAKRIQDAGLKPSSFILEITESAAMGNIELTTDILTRFRLKGFALSMDDFGTGFSSLIQLYRLPFSELKIDRSFIMEVNHNEEAKIIVKSIVDLAKNLGLTTCAEGVETKFILDYCRKIGCNNIQGYHISKPLPANELSNFLKTFQFDAPLPEA